MGEPGTRDAAAVRDAERAVLQQIIDTQRLINVAALSPDEVMDVVAERAQAITGAAGAAVELVEGDEMVYCAVAGNAAPHRGMRLKAAASISGLCVAEGRALCCDETETDPRVDRDACRAVGARSLVVVPLRHLDETTGVLKVMAPVPAAFGDGEIATLEVLAGFIATSIAHAAAHAQRAERLEALNAIDGAMLAAGSASDIAVAATERLRAVTHAARVSVAEFDHNRDRLNLLAAAITDAGAQIEEGSFGYDDALYPAERLAAGEVLCRDDLQTLAVTSPLVERLQATGLHGYLSIPLLAEGALLGTLNLAFERAGAPAADLVAIAREAADHIALALRHSALRAQLQAVIDASLDGIVVVDSERHIIAANPAASAICNRPAAELVGMRIYDALNHEPDATAWNRFLANGLLDILLDVDVTGTRRHVEVRGRAHALPGVHLLITRDVTDRLQLEDQLLQAQKMEAIGRLAGGVAHDFNNLLTVIANYTKLAQDEVSAASVRSDLDAVRDAARRAQQLTSQLLAFSRRQMLEPTRLDLAEVVRSHVPLLERLIGEDVTVTVTGEQAVPPVLADRGQIEQVVMNLAVNARDAMTTGGRLTIDTAAVDSARGDDIGVPGAEPGRYVRVSVSDTGPGIDDETVGRIFEPFFTTKPVGAGTGLGLAMVHGIVTQSGGHVVVDTQLGRGTTFHLYLPVDASNAATPAPTAGPEPASAVRGSETILLCEDEEALRRLIERLLTAEGYTVIAAPDAEAAVALAADHPEIDAIVSDVVMPTLSGPELVERVRALRPGVKVLFMSGYSDDVVRERAAFSHDHTFIAKPFTPDVLLDAVRSLFDHDARVASN